MQFVYHLNFLVLPQISPFYFEDEYNLNDAVSATCTVTKGDLPLEIWWSLTEIGNTEPQRLSTNEEVTITRTGKRICMLSIDAVKARHRGNYSCMVSNKAGSTQYSAQLAINGL